MLNIFAMIITNHISRFRKDILIIKFTDFKTYTTMAKDRIILKTHGLRNSKEAGIIILPESFYVTVEIEKNGDFTIEFFNAGEEQLFSVTDTVNGTVKGEPVSNYIQETQKWMSGQIVDMLAEHLLQENSLTFDTDAALSTWRAMASHAFRDCEVEWNTDKK